MKLSKCFTLNLQILKTRLSMKHISQKKKIGKLCLKRIKVSQLTNKSWCTPPGSWGTHFGRGMGDLLNQVLKGGGGACPYQQSVKEKQLKKSRDLNYFILRNRKLCWKINKSKWFISWEAFQLYLQLLILLLTWVTEDSLYSWTGS